MKLGRVCLVSLVCLVLVGGVAWGEPGKPGKKAKKAPPTPEELFTQMDTNKDKAVNVDELLAMKQIKGDKEVAQKILAAWDANKDGKATEEEFKKFLESQAQQRERQFVKVDLNADKALTLDEIKSVKQVGGDETKAKAFLERLDDDKDGKVSMAEFTRVRNIFQVPPAEKEKKKAK
jgi:Ca2+-binding EF-hand superfamily protein